jgi:serine/threonine protein kinase
LSDDSDARAHARVGDVLNDKWTLERLLGIGGMGAVYAARHRNGARAAVKILHRYLSKHEQVRERFLREGYAANLVDRPGVVKVLDDDIVAGGPDDGTAYLVMELLEGESLEDRVERGPPVTEREFLVIADAVLEVLDAAHTHGVVHRDIKPENIFVARDESGTDRIKVLDFGLARLLEGHSTTTYGLALGTPSFMSPEQAAGRIDEIDGRTDLFALAASGFRLVTGRKVHEAANPIELVMKMAKTPAPRIRTVAPRVSDAFARVIDRALEFRREDRYESAAAMRADVQNAIAALDMGVKSTAPPAPPPLGRTIELSGSDLEDLEPADAPMPAALERAPKGRLELELAMQSEGSLPMHPEESLSPIPRQLGCLVLVPALVLFALAGIGAKLAYSAGWFARFARPSPVLSESRDAGVPTRDASTDANVAADAVAPDAVAANAADASVTIDASKDASPAPKPRPLPSTPPTKPPAPRPKPKRPKH